MVMSYYGSIIITKYFRNGVIYDFCVEDSFFDEDYQGRVGDDGSDEHTIYRTMEKETNSPVNSYVLVEYETGRKHFESSQPKHSTYQVVQHSLNVEHPTNTIYLAIDNIVLLLFNSVQNYLSFTFDGFLINYIAVVAIFLISGLSMSSAQCLSTSVGFQLL